MFVCNHCKAEFDYPDTKEWREYHGDGIYEDWLVNCCPLCKCEDFDEIEEEEEEEHDRE